MLDIYGVQTNSSFTSSNNNIHICGEITEDLKFNYESYGEKFYTSSIKVQRTSGSYDEIPLCISERFITEDKYNGKIAVIEGQVRTHRLKDASGESHVAVSIFVKSMYLVLTNTNENKARFNGYICKVNKPRNTPKGKTISDVILAVNREFNKSDYIPCICWGSVATKAYDAGVGANLDLVGRLQSRSIKDNTRTVYEISVANLRVIG